MTGRIDSAVSKRFQDMADAQKSVTSKGKAFFGREDGGVDGEAHFVACLSLRSEGCFGIAKAFSLLIWAISTACNKGPVSSAG